jgi:hypothetical protein
LNGHQFTGIRLAINVQRSTFSVWRLAFGVWRRGQNGANTFELTPAALLLGFEQPNLYEGFERPTANRQRLTAER